MDKAYGIIETVGPLHVGATAGEETGNLNLIFRDQFTQTGIVPGSSIRGRLRSEMRLERQKYLKKELDKRQVSISESEVDEDDDNALSLLQLMEKKAKELEILTPHEKNENLWYGHEAVRGEPDSTSESLIKFEYASILWLPVFCPGRPIVWVTCPRLLRRYQRIAGITAPNGKIPEPYTGSANLDNKLFFNFGFLTIEHANQDLSAWFPDQQNRPAVVVGDDEISMIHDMALYRQSRIAMKEDQKVVKNFFGLEALPEETFLVFPIAHKPDKEGNQWKLLQNNQNKIDLYLGGLESIGFGHCELTVHRRND
ncbi:RAMP superfamily CRISPR-associated protein [Alkalinema sp. FACHB-956]|uniref:RAMP superfamily CRISPR-associated protein n=1 Tax=Alkalinema sp. FACHB-956 TaxID=2692768 RepID=UPI001686B56E|nr:RAMP superfamily CRISPR-associated protein [Alkalinema sp. FACHB-956]MBD2327968.1 type III-B CRISPR module RAMP protein Cmr4 [Alkalinema sp. FACHB-956]